MNHYFAYIRVSTTKQGEQGVSLEQQRAAIEAYCTRNDLRLVRWFTEQETAAKRGRPVFEQMLKALRQGGAVGVVIHKIDRSARNLRDWADLGELSDSGIKVHFANESIDLESRGGRLSADIQAVVAADFIRNLREETKKGFYGRLKQGLYPRPAPIGYRDQGPGLVKAVDENMAPLVRRAFEEYSSGRYNLLELTEKMWTWGLRTKQGRKVKHQPLAKVLCNPFYIGLIKIAGQAYQGQHEPIVSSLLFRRVQDVLQGKTHRKGQKHELLFRQMFTCEEHHRCLVGERQKGHIYYRCHAKSCRSKTIREERLEAQTIKTLKLLEFTQSEKDYFRLKLLELTGSWQSQQQSVVNGLQLRLKQLDDRRSRLTDAFLDEAIAREDFEQRKTALIKERCALNDQIGEVIRDSASGPTKLQRTFELASSAYLLYRNASDDEKRELLKTLSSNRSLDGETLKIMLKLPFRLVAERTLSVGGCPKRSIGRDVSTIWDDLIPRLLHQVSETMNV